MKTILLLSPYWKEEHRWMVSTVKLADLWQRIGYRVVVVCMGRAGNEKCTTKNEKCSIEKASDTLEIHRVPDIFLKDPWNYGIAWGFSGYALRLAREINPDVIVVNKVLFWSSIALLRLRAAGFRVLLLTDALVGITWWPRGRFAQVCSAIYAWTLGWAILRAATRVVFFHPQPPAVLQRLGIEKKSMVIPTGIDLSGFTPTPLAPTPLPKGEGTFITYIGRLESVKGVDDFVAAALLAQKDHPELQIRVVGWFADGHPLVEAYRDRVEFTGLRDDIPAVLAATDIFVLPSYSEGLSNALMEAMASGCACIASDVGGNRFLIQSGVSGFLFPAGDREALASHIRRLVEDFTKRASLGAQARKRIEEVFTWEKVGKQYRDLFTQWTTTAGRQPSPSGLRPPGETRSLSSTMKKIVILSAFLSPYRSGAEAMVEEVSVRLADAYDITIVTGRYSRNLPREDFLPLPSTQPLSVPPPPAPPPGSPAANGRERGDSPHVGVRVIRVGFGCRFDKWLYPFLAPLVVRSLQPDIIHAVLETFAGLALCFCRSTAKKILTLQTTNRSFLKGPILRCPDTLTAISTALVHTARAYGREDTVLIPNGIDVAAIRAACAQHAKVPGRILFVGRLEHMKGVDTLLEALSDQRLAQSAFTLHIVGDGSERGALEARAKALGLAGCVVFRGRLIGEPLLKEYAEAEIFSGLSRSEALGNVFLEAAAAGCAVVATDVGGIPDIVKEGETGILVPSEAPVAAAEAIRGLLMDLARRGRLGAAARKHAQGYDWSIIAEMYRKLY